jgi:hypothetical protein
VRNWRLTEATVGAPAHDQHALLHLPPGSALREHPMPRDAELLSDLARDLLRVARRPHVPAPPPNPADAKPDKNGGDGGAKTNGDAGADDEKGAHGGKRKAAVAAQRRGFPVRRWSQMSKGYDEPDREYLAKRRRGLPPIVDGFNPIAGPVLGGAPGAGAQGGAGAQQQFRALKVKRVDATGRARVYDVMAPVGVVVEGEISAEEAARITAGEAAAAVAVVETAAPGTIIEGVGVVNAEGVVIAQPTPKRKPLPPRRKPKKSGPGRKSAAQLQQLQEQQAAQQAQQAQQATGATGTAPENGVGVAGATAVGAEGTAPGAANGSADTLMHDAHDDEDDEDEDEGDEEGSSHAMDEDYDERGGGSAGSTPGGGARSVRFSEDAAAAGGTRTPDDAAQGSTPGFVGSSLKTEVKLEEEATPSGDEHHLRTMDNEPLADILAPQGGEEGYGDGADDMKMDHDGNDDDPFAPGAERALAMAQVPEFTMGGVKDDDESKGLEGAAEDDGFFASAVELDDGGAAFADAAAPMGEAGTPLTFPPMTHLDEELGVDDGLAGFEQPLLQFDGTFLSPSTENKNSNSVAEHAQLPGLVTSTDFDSPLPALGELAAGEGGAHEDGKEATFSLLDSLEAHLNASPAADVASFAASEEKDSG